MRSLSSRAIARTLLGGAALVVLVAAPAHAQLGKLRKAAGEIAKDAAVSAVVPDAPSSNGAAATGSASSGPANDSWFAVVRENGWDITEEKLAAFASGLSAERAERDRVKPLIAAFDKKSHDRCMDDLAQDAEYVKLQSESWEVASSAMSNEQKEAAFQKLGEKQDQIRTRKCGATGGELSDSPKRVAVQRSGLDARTYDVLKERLVPYCRNEGKQTATKTGERVGRYSYHSSEVAVLQGKCAALWPDLQAVI